MTREQQEALSAMLYELGRANERKKKRLVEFLEKHGAVITMHFHDACLIELPGNLSKEVYDEACRILEE